MRSTAVAACPQSVEQQKETFTFITVEAETTTLRENFSGDESLWLTCALQPVALLVSALVTVDVAVAELGELEELKNVRRLVHLAAEVAVLEVQEEHFSPQSMPESSE